MRYCSVCEKSENEVEFYKTGSYCAACAKAYRKEYGKKQRQRAKEDSDFAKEFKAKKRKWYTSRAGKPRTITQALTDLVRHAQRRAQINGISFDLTKEWVLAQYTEQQGCCALTGIPFNIVSGDLRANPYTPSLDRITPGSGYTQDNVRLICFAMNAALNEWGEEVFLKVAQAYCARKG